MGLVFELLSFDDEEIKLVALSSSLFFLFFFEEREERRQNCGRESSFVRARV